MALMNASRRMLLALRSAGVPSLEASAAQLRSGAARAWSSSGVEQEGNSSKGEQQGPYVYQSPGSSIHDPLGAHSLSNPVHHYDPGKPRPPAQPIHNANRAPQKQQQQQQQARPTAAYAAQQVQQGRKEQQQDASPKPYVYASPGSSVREPSYGVSVSDPVYVVDPAPAPSSSTGAPQPPKKKDDKGRQQVAQAPPAGRRRVGLPADDLADQPYATTPRGSMHEPKYVSVSDPQDVGGTARK